MRSTARICSVPGFVSLLVVLGADMGWLLVACHLPPHLEDSLEVVEEGKDLMVGFCLLSELVH